MSGSVGTNVTKIVGALGLSAALVYFLVLPTVDVLTRPHAASDGPRALIVASTQGGTRDYVLHAFMQGEVNGEMHVSLLATAADDDATGVETISLHVAFFGPRGRAGTVRCQDEEEAVPSRPWDDLGEGARGAFLQDVGSTTAGAHPMGTAAEAPRAGSFPQWRGTVSVVTDEGEHAWSTAALRCTIPASWVWVSVPRQTTGLLPQVNFNAEDNTTDHQADLVGEVRITRRSEWTLSESYPAATLDGYYLTQTLSRYWVGHRGDPGNLWYLTQPDLMFVQRYTSEDDAKTLTVGGIAIGVAGSLVVSSMARFVDIVAAGVRRARRRGEE